MNASELVNQISSVSLPGVFNPYSDICYAHDHDQSPTVRRQNLRRYLEAIIIREIDSVWVGRDFGYRGGRRTGIALTDEAHLATFRDYFQLTGVAKATHSDEVRERTATYVWNIILEVKAEAFLWNVFPFHPFEAGNPFSNRRHTSREFGQCRELLVALLKLIRPKRIIAIGGDAEKSLSRLGFKVHPVRHPSYGGHRDFAAAIRKIYIRPATKRR